MIDLPDLSRALRNRPRVLRAYRRARRRLLGVLPAPDYPRLDPIRDLAAAAPRARFDRPAPTVEGWLSPDEQAALYILARQAPGPVAEIGCWLGKSAICLSRGLRDGKNTASPTLLCCDLFPTEANFREVSPGMMGFFYPPGHPLPMGVNPREEYEAGIRPALVRPGGLRGVFERNLREAGVWPHVVVHEGDFHALPDGPPHALVFCDAMHDETEIRRNAPDLMRLLRPGSILCCHDADESNARLTRRYFSFAAETTVDSLLVGRVARMFPAGDAP